MDSAKEMVDIDLAAGVTVAVRFVEYAHSTEHGTILIAHWSGPYTLRHSRCNDLYMTGMMKAALRIREPTGAILDVSSLRLRNIQMGEGPFLTMTNPVTDSHMPSAVVLSPVLRSTMAETIGELEGWVLRRKYFFDSLAEALDCVLPQIKRLGC